MNSDRDGRPKSREEIDALFDVAGREPEAIRQLTNSVDELLEVQAAKQALAALQAADVRAALELRQLRMRRASS
jgi:uncharacterized protein (DUF2236 family)